MVQNGPVSRVGAPIPIVVVHRRIVLRRIALLVIDLPHVQEIHALLRQGLGKDRVGRGRFLAVVVEIIGELVLKVHPLFRKAHITEGAAQGLHIGAQRAEILGNGRSAVPVRLLGVLVKLQLRQQDIPDRDNSIDHRTAHQLHLHPGIQLQQRSPAWGVVGIPALGLRAEAAVPHGFRRQLRCLG